MVTKSRKGISEVVASVLLVLLTVSVIAVLIGILRPFAEDNLNESTECLAFADVYKFEQTFNNIQFNCYQERNNSRLIGATIRAGAGLEQEDRERLKGFILVFKDANGNAESVEMTNGKIVRTITGGVWLFRESTAPTIEINKPNEVITYVYNSTKAYDIIEINPLLSSGRICDEIDSISLRRCSGVILE